MNTPSPPPEKRRVKVSYGTLPSPKIASLAASHPFSQQLDVVFPSNPVLLEALRRLETVYAETRVRLVDVLNHADVFSTSGENGSNQWIICTTPSEDEDAWCVDPRGHLTLSVSTSSYERLGLVGKKLPFKNQEDRHVIELPLRKDAQSAVNQAKQKKSLEDWDARRETEHGKEAGLWNVLYHSNDIGSSKNPFEGSEARRVQCKSQEFRDLRVPTPSLHARPECISKQQSKSKLSEQNAEELEDWNLKVLGLFEWVGMGCLGAQRLRANDRVDPYVAVYEPPQPSRMENVTHLQWCGLLSPTFVKQIIDMILSTLQNTTSSTTPFVGITCQALSSSPVSYIPYTVSSTGALQPPPTVPPKLPRKDGEDCWSLIVERSTEGNSSANGSPQRVDWCLAESIGQWDVRWG